MSYGWRYSPALWLRTRPISLRSGAGRGGGESTRLLTSTRESRLEIEAIFERPALGEAAQHRAERIFVWSVEKARDPSRVYEIHLMKDLIGFNRWWWTRLVITIGRTLYVVTDPRGFRPLALGRLDDAWVIASETCAFDLIDAKYVRDIEPGEMVRISRCGVESIHFAPAKPHHFCIFEHVYFARPDSTVFGRAVNQSREMLGRLLAKEQPANADIVVPVPDSGNCAALGYSLESGIPFEMAFVRNHYVGRSFLQPSQLIRDFDVRVKLNLITELVRGKRVVIVDDSIVRGTTCKARVKTLKDAGAKEVHVMVSCPPHMNPCVYGIDFPDRNKLMAANYSLQDIRKYLNADSLHYLSQEGMVRATGLPRSSFCMACYDGDYPVKYDPTVDKLIMERRRGRTCHEIRARRDHGGRDHGQGLDEAKEDGERQEVGRDPLHFRFMFD